MGTGTIGIMVGKKVQEGEPPLRLDIFPYKPGPHPELFDPHEKNTWRLDKASETADKKVWWTPQYIRAKCEKAVPDVRFLCVPWGGGRRDRIQMNLGCPQASVQWSCTIVSI